MSFMLYGMVIYRFLLHMYRSLLHIYRSLLHIDRVRVSYDACSFACLQGSFAYLQGSFSKLQGSLAYLQGSFAYLQGSFAYLQGLFAHLLKRMGYPSLGHPREFPSDPRRVALTNSMPLEGFNATLLGPDGRHSKRDVGGWGRYPHCRYPFFTFSVSNPFFGSICTKSITVTMR